jgi:hypothetical protein
MKNFQNFWGSQTSQKFQKYNLKFKKTSKLLSDSERTTNHFGRQIKQVIIYTTVLETLRVGQEL